MDLRDDPDWAPLTGTFHAGDWDVAVWAEPSLPGGTTFDPWCVRVFSDRLRLAVADPAATCPDLTASDVAWSGLTVIGAFHVEDDLHAALNAAAARLHDPARSPRLANPCAQVAAVDLELRGSDITAVRAGDCEVWVKRSGRWAPLLAGARLTEAAQAAFAAHPGAHRSAGAAAHYAAHVDVLDDPAVWHTAPVGLDFPVRTQEMNATDVEEVIVADDGARLTVQRCATLSSWLAGGLQVAPEDHPHPSPHGDVAVLHARRRRGAALVHCRTCGVRLEQRDDGWWTPDGELCCERPRPTT